MGQGGRTPRLSGIHYALPWPIDKVYKLKVRELRRRVIGGDIPDTVLGRTQAATSEFFSGDQNLINIRVVAQYSVSNPRDFLFQAQDADRIVGLAVESELVRRVAHTTVDRHSHHAKTCHPNRRPEGSAKGGRQLSDWGPDFQHQYRKRVAAA
jgi:regulator of protease activity HflC (stomatin/prohibitin superfamily)